MKRFVIGVLVLCFVGAVGFAVTAHAAQVTFSWTASTSDDVAGYRLFQRVQGQSYDYNSPTWEGEGTGCTIEFEAGSNGEKYYWVARAFDTSDNDSVDSNEVDWTAPDTTPPDAPSLLIDAINLAIKALDKLKEAVALSNGLTIEEVEPSL